MRKIALGNHIDKKNATRSAINEAKYVPPCIRVVSKDVQNLLYSVPYTPSYIMTVVLE